MVVKHLAFEEEEITKLVEEIHKNQPPGQVHLPETCPACKLMVAYQVSPGSVPVSEKLREAFKTIRHNFHARERLDNLMRVIREQYGDKPNTVWGAVLEEMTGIQNVLLEAGFGGQTPIEPQGKIFYQEDLAGLKCACSDCEGHGVFIHSKCHVGHPIWAEYSPGQGVLIIRCSVCDKPVAQIAVGKDNN